MGFVFQYGVLYHWIYLALFTVLLWTFPKQQILCRCLTFFVSHIYLIEITVKSLPALRAFLHKTLNSILKFSKYGCPGVGRNMLFLSSPHLCFIIVFICDLFVSLDDPLMS